MLLDCQYICDGAELGQKVVKLEERCNKLGADNAELEAADDRLRTTLSQMEQTKKDLQHKASRIILTFHQIVFRHSVDEDCSKM